MSDKPSLMDFTEMLRDEYGAGNGSSARAGQIGEFYFKCVEDTEHVFRWTDNEWEEVGIVQFDTTHKARSKHRELSSASGDGVSWDPEGFVEKYS